MQTSRSEHAFPLTPRRRLLGLSFGALRSARRGMGSDVAGSRPYRPGDDVGSIDWNASARLSTARDNDEFIVRERFADEAPRIVVVADRRPAMALYGPPLPWLSKPDAMRVAARLISASAIAARGFLGYLDCGTAEPYWNPPRTQQELSELSEGRPFAASEDNLTHALEHLGRVGTSLPAGTFVFVLSDFLVSPPEEAWIQALERRWDVVPVVIQDPIWEQSFPDVAGVVVPIADPRSGKTSLARLGAREVAERRLANEQRRERLVDGFRGLDLEPVLVSSAALEAILAAFLSWSEQRLNWRGHAW